MQARREKSHIRFVASSSRQNKQPDILLHLRSFLAPTASVQDLRGHTLLHSATTSSAWSEWLTLAGAPHLKPVHHMEFEHVHLQLEAALNGLGIALASLPLNQADLASGRLICPISKPEWSAQDYLLLSEYQEEDAAVRAFRSWITDTARAMVR